MVNAERMESERNKRSELVDLRLHAGSNGGDKEQPGEDGGGKESDDDTAPGPIKKTANGRLLIPLRKSRKRHRRSGSTSSDGSSHSAKLSPSFNTDKQKTSIADSHESQTKDSEPENGENEEDFSENSWSRGEDGEF